MQLTRPWMAWPLPAYLSPPRFLPVLCCYQTWNGSYILGGPQAMPQVAADAVPCCCGLPNSSPSLSFQSRHSPSPALKARATVSPPRACGTPHAPQLLSPWCTCSGKPQKRSCHHHHLTQNYCSAVPGTPTALAPSLQGGICCVPDNGHRSNVLCLHSIQTSQMRTGRCTEAKRQEVLEQELFLKIYFI